MAKISSFKDSDSTSAERTKVRPLDDDLELTDDCLLAIADNWRRESEKVRSSREPRAPESRPATSERRAERARRKRSRFNLDDAILTFFLCVLACGILGIWIVCVERSRAPSAINASTVSSTTSELAKPFENTRSEPRTTQTNSAAMKTAPLSPALQFTSRVLQGKPVVAFIELAPRALQSALSEPRLPSATLAASQTSATVAERSVVIEPCRISEIGIGDRLPGENPQGNDGSGELEFLLKPHCVYSLRYEKEDGTFCNIKLLRPDDWLNTVESQIRRVSDGKVLDEIDLQLLEWLPLTQTQACDVEVWLELEELGCVGWATVVDVDDSFEYGEGVGNLVTGTFEHEVGEVVDLQLEGQDKLIGVTLTHPFWSVDREDFVTVADLYEDERVFLYSGETKRVVQKLPRPGPQVVYNLEVFGEHVYHVTPDGALVHNSGCGKKIVKRKLRNEDHVGEFHKKTGVFIGPGAWLQFPNEGVIPFGKVKITGQHALDNKECDKVLAKLKPDKYPGGAREVEKFRQKNDYIWHHGNGQMELVPGNLHRGTGHTGPIGRGTIPSIRKKKSLPSR